MGTTLDGKVDRTAVSVRPLSAPDDTLAYWLTKTPQERMCAAEELRQLVYGYDPATARLQRVLAVAKLEGR